MLLFANNNFGDLDVEPRGSESQQGVKLKSLHYLKKHSTFHTFSTAKSKRFLTSGVRRIFFRWVEGVQKEKDVKLCSNES